MSMLMICADYIWCWYMVILYADVCADDMCSRYLAMTVDADLREFACELTSSWPPARVEGRVWAALLG